MSSPGPARPGSPRGGTSPADLLLIHGRLFTLAGFSDRPAAGADMGRVGLIADGYVATQGDRILAVGGMQDLPAALAGRDTTVLDAGGRAVFPGFVDPHTHAVYAGSRAGEFGLRLQGASYLEILAQGGGILSTVAATRAATETELVEGAAERLERFLQNGTTTVEVKSGYGLGLEPELKQLRAVRRLQASTPQTLVPTFLGAHAVPAEYRQDRAAYIALILEEMLPAVAHEGLARFADVFCEAGVFDLAESRRLLTRARELGLGVKLHADELAPFGGAELAAELGAASADHLLHASAAGLQAMARQGVIAVLLPGTAFFLREQYAPARRMVELGVPIALATDHNPGTCTLESMAAVIGLACLEMRLTPAEALTASTINAAHALGLGKMTGSLEAGKRADLIVLDGYGPEDVVYHFGRNEVATVVAGGRLAVAGRQALEAQHGKGVGT
ncbi:MAG: imidazolonepropionase [Symbiobacteriia bacterium]